MNFFLTFLLILIFGFGQQKSPKKSKVTLEIQNIKINKNSKSFIYISICRN